MTLSVRSALNCLGHAGNASVVRDLFGLSYVPRPLSLRRQLELLKGEHLNLNIILVAPENFAPDEPQAWQEIFGGIQIAREIFSQVDLGIGKLEYWHISAAQAGTYAVTDSEAEARALADDWTVPNDMLDVFIVRRASFAGRSSVDGPCDKNSKSKMNGCVVSLLGDTANVGNTLAHELAHYLGLNHVLDDNNFIGGDGGSDAWTGIYAWQGDIMKKHCFVRPGCPG